MLHRKKEIQFIFVMTVIDGLNSTAEAVWTDFPQRTLGALGKMLYDSKMMKSFLQSFAVFEPAGTGPAALRVVPRVAVLES